MKNVLFALLLGAVSIAHATGDIDLSYVDKSGTAYSRYKSYVDSCNARNDCYGYSAIDPAYMAKLDGGAQYCTRAVALADAYVTKVETAIAGGGQPNWGADANGIDGISSDSYLHVGANLMAITLPMKWCAATITPSQVSRFTAVITQSVYNVWHPAQATWGGHSFPWSGWATTDPANNYFYSFTQATDLYQWVTGDAQYASRTWPLITSYMATIPTGGSEEGTGYGASHKDLFGTMRIHRDLFGTNYADSHLMNSILYWLYASTPGFQSFAGIGDQSRVSMPTWWDYQDVLVMQACALTTDAGIKAQGAWLLAHTPPISNSLNYRDALLSNACGATQTAPTGLAFIGASTGDLFVRQSWANDTLWAAFRAGKYDQSHAHQDQGAVSLYKSGWLVFDESIESHSGIEQGVINNGTIHFLHGTAVTPQTYNSVSTMSVTGYDPAIGVHAIADLKATVPSAVNTWTRNFDFVGNTVTVTDAYSAKAGYQGVWSISTMAQPVITGKTAVAGGLTITVVSPADAVLSATDWRTVSVPSYGYDYGAGWRLDVSSATNNGYTVALSVGGASPPPPPPVCTNPQPPTTPVCSDGSHQTGGVWQESAYPQCAWTYTNGVCPSPPPPPPPAPKIKVTQGRYSFVFDNSPLCTIVNTALAGSYAKTVNHWHCVAGAQVYDFPSAASFVQSKQ